MAMSDGFSDFGGRTWLNCSHQGALPLSAAAAAREAIDWKLSPIEMTTERFVGVPRRLRELLARLIGADADDIVLANGASYGLHLLANGLPLGKGDEVLLMEGDFPSNILPWLGLRRRGVEVRLAVPADKLLRADEVEALLSRSPKTRVLCLSWVHSFSGRVADLAAIGEICKQSDTIFIANTTQGLGARVLDVSSIPVDAIVNAGWKYLCGPYATGFAWMRPEIRESLTTNQSYWLSTFTSDDLGAPRLDLDKRPEATARRFDLFATANFFNTVPWTASIELLLDKGLERIASYDRELVKRFLDGLDRDRYRLSSSEEDPSTLVFVAHREPSRNPAIHRALAEAGVDVALRAGELRISPHLYNTQQEIDRALEVLEHAG